MANRNINYFKIGIFVLVGIGLIIFALLIFGSSKLFQPVVYVETYFEESIQGISEGTPVKYRGLQIGYVKKIAFAGEVYDDKLQNRSIYVKIAITTKLFTRLTTDQLKAFLSREVVQGLRVKLVTQGLTGTSYLELNYADPASGAPTAIIWQPHDFYIPSATSTLTRLSENVQEVVQELKDVDFKALFDNINLSAISLAKLANTTDNFLNQINNSLVATMQNLRVISGQLKLNPSSMVFGKPPPPLDPSKL